MSDKLNAPSPAEGEEKGSKIRAVIDCESTLEQFLSNPPPLKSYTDKGNFDLPTEPPAIEQVEPNSGEQ